MISSRVNSNKVEGSTLASGNASISEVARNIIRVGMASLLIAASTANITAYADVKVIKTSASVNARLELATSSTGVEGVVEYGPGYEEEEEAIAVEEASLRDEVVEYALSFVGGRYVYGGVDPNKGVDCSGFTRYIMANVADIELDHSARSQARTGIEVSSEDMQVGDLVFYGSRKYINHVAIYIGEGQVVHASNSRNGIIVSDINYRTPVKIVNIIDSVDVTAGASDSVMTADTSVDEVIDEADAIE